METLAKLEVYYAGRLVGIIAPYQRYQSAFEYSREWLEEGFSISPFSLPLQRGVRVAKADPFDGLFGIFADSLPDGWGRLLVDRMMRKKGMRPEEVDAFTRLSIVGDSGMGALEYVPSNSWKMQYGELSLDQLARECERILQAKDSAELDALFALGGSSGGARPKVMIQMDGEEWIVKFPSSYDSAQMGAMEYDYHQCAAECGIEVPPNRLFPSGSCEGYFGSKRFDRIATPQGVRKIHMASASALLEVSHRIPALDYTSLMALTWQLTKRMEEVEKMFRLMCFNIYAHNRDDHSNNFSFLFRDGTWQLAPAYDLTYSNSLRGEHATTVNGEGRSPSIKDILSVAAKAGIRVPRAKEIAEHVSDIVHDRLGKYLG